MYRISEWNKSRERKMLLIAWGIALLALLVSLLLLLFWEPVTISFLDVGQGDACLVQAGRDGAVLIDGGDVGQGHTLVSYLENQNVRKLNAVFLSHFHEDHASGILELLEADFPIERFYLSKYDSHTDTETTFLAMAATRSIPVFRLEKSDTIKLGKAEYTVVGLEDFLDEEHLNNMSMVLRIEYGSSSVLLTGDLESAAAKRLVKNPGGELKCDIFKVPHHGGISSLSQELISICNPDYAVISVGENYYGNPSAAVLSSLLAREITIYRTDRDGTVVITLGKKGIKSIFYGYKWR